MEGVTKRLIDHLQSKRVSHVYSNFTSLFKIAKTGLFKMILRCLKTFAYRAMIEFGSDFPLFPWIFQDDNGITFTTFYSHHA